MKRLLPALCALLLPLAPFAAQAPLPSAAPIRLEAPAINPVERPQPLLAGLFAAEGTGEPEPLTVDQAFRMETLMAGGDTLVAHWTIAPGHYLYREKFAFNLVDGKGITLGKAILPAGEEKDDEIFGKIRVFHGQVEARVPVQRTGAAHSFSVEIRFQGCSEAGLCYPPERKQVRLTLPAADPAPAVSAAPTALGPTALATASSAAAEPANESGEARFARILNSGTLWAVALAALVAGLLMAFTACMYPMIPILSSIIVGQGQQISPSRGFGLSLTYVGAVALTFGLLGGVTALVGNGVGIQASFQSPWLLIPFALLFVALAFAMFGFYDIQMPSAIQSRLNTLSNRQQGGSLIGVGLMGVFSALIVGPCGGPFLIAALAFAASSGSFGKGFTALFMLGFGMGLPLLLIGLGGGTLLPRAGNWMKTIKAAAGVILLSVALLFLERMPSLFPPGVTMLLWATLLIVVGIYLGALDPLVAGGSGWRRLWKGLGLATILYGVVVMLGGLTGGTTLTDPLRHASFASAAVTGGETPGKTVPVGLEFKRIKSVSELRGELAAAKAEGRPVMLDFYADWCTYCKEFETYVFSDPAVKQALGNTVLLQADVTATDEQDKALMKELGVFLPPAILFFDVNGQERAPFRVVGFKEAGEFRKVVEKALPR